MKKKAYGVYQQTGLDFYSGFCFAYVLADRFFQPFFRFAG